MPIGDPGGGNFTYTVEGLPKSIFVAVVPVKDPVVSIPFYRDFLGMEETYRTEDEVGMRRESARLILRRSAGAGVDLGIYIGVDNPYDLHRRLIDEGVRFIKDPMREPWGVSTAFMDPDDNIIHAIEMNAEVRP